MYLVLFIEFIKIGLFALGGGPATIPFLMDLIENYGWYSEEEFTNMIAISESTPGPLGINMATYAGYHAGGILGSIIATLSLVLPSLVIIILIARFLANFSNNEKVRRIFCGIRPAVAALITASVIGILRTTLFVTIQNRITLQWKTFILFVVVLILMRVKKLQNIHPGLWILGAACIGIFMS